MKRIVFALTLAVCLAFTALVFTAQADTALTLSVSSGSDYKTVEDALAAVEQMAAKGELNEKGVVLVLSGNHTATVKNGILFGQKTIFLPSGKKLPVCIQGGTLNLPAGNIACANDYTFDNIKIPLDDTATKLFAGSGNVTLGKITVDLNGSAEYKSYFYGDTFTAAVFEGWTEQSLALHSENGLFVSSVTLSDGFVYDNPSGFLYAAVGSSTDFAAKIGTRMLSADDTCAKLIIDGATVHSPTARYGKNPVANSVLHVKSGSIYHLHGIASGGGAEYVGDVTVLTEGGTFRHFVRILNAATVRGNLTVSLKNVDLLANENVDDARMIEIGFSGSSVIGDVNVTMENVKADRYYGSMGGKTHKVTGDVTVTAKSCEFSRFFRSGFGQSPIYGSVTNVLENVQLGAETNRGLDECSLLGKADEYTGENFTVGNLTNHLKNVTFAEPASDTSSYLGASVTCAIAGSITNTLENVTTPVKHSLYCASYNGTVNGNITNTFKSGTFSHYLYGGPYQGTVKGTLRNNVQGGTYLQEVFLGGYSCKITGKVENRVSGGDFNKLYLYCGTRNGNAESSSHYYSIENYFTGGSFKGVWGGGGNGTASVQKGNIYNEISDGYFGVYNYDGKINSFAGSTRNGAHTGNVDTLIRGGHFEGYVYGGSIPNQEDWCHDNPGRSTLTLAGGTFKYIIDAASRWGTYAESALYVNTEKALQPLSIDYDLDCESFIAANDSAVSLQTMRVNCKDLIARGKEPLQVFGEVHCDSFTVENGAASPEIYGKVYTKNLNSPIAVTLGAKGFLSAEAVVGKIRLLQSECWLARTYFTSPAGTDIVLSALESVYGDVEAKNGVVKGISSAFQGVSFVFNDSISLRFFFDKEWVDSAKDSFLFNVTCTDRAIVDNVKYADLVLKDGYYTVLSDALSVTELCDTLTASGTLMENRSFTLLQLAETGIQIHGKDGQNKELGNLLKAFSNYAVASGNYKNKTSNPLPYENPVTETGFVSGDGFAPLIATPWVQITNKQLILDEGMRIRYYLQSVEMLSTMQTSSPVNDLHYFHNCLDITNRVTKKWVSTSTRKGYFEITVDFPVAASKSKDPLRFIVTEKSTLAAALPADSTAPYTTYVSEDYIDRLDTFAEDLAKTEGSEELGSALLYFLQSGADYYKTQPDISELVYPTEFSAGYAREDFSPYGYNMDMYSGKFGSVVLDPMYVTCLALWDGDELALFYSFDFRGSADAFTVKYKNVLKNELKDLIDTDKIFFNATHNHSGPNASSMSSATVIHWYETIFDDAFMMATKKAILDLAPCKLYAGTATSDPGTNYVRRYVNADGTFTGIHNIIPATNVVSYETEADKELRTLRFTREGKKDIVYANWQGHAAHGAVYYYQFTADFVGFLRDGVEEDMDVHFIYCNGASGNLNFTPKVPADIEAKYFTSPYFQGVGKSLVGTVKKSVKSDHEIQTGEFQVTHIPFVATVKHEDADTVERAKAANELLKAYREANDGKDMPAKQIQAQTGFQSKYHISHTITRSNMGEVATIDVFAFSFGDVGMAFVPYEQFDTNAMQTRDAVKDLYEITFTGAYTNGSKSYIPSAYAAPHDGYEVYSSRYVDSTGDDIAFALADALKAMKNK